MGFLHSGICYQDINSAYQSYGSSFPIPSPTSSFYASKLFDPALTSGFVTGLFKLDYFTVTPNSVFYSNTVIISPPVFPACDPLQPYMSGMYYGSVIALAFITVSLLAMLRRAL